MTTVVRRTFASTPHRDACDTWRAIVDVLVQGTEGARKTELLAVHGIASSLIADKAPKDTAIVVTCDGPRTRIYCLYDEDATEGSDADENALGFDPLNGDWAVSLPCDAEDLDWVQRALLPHSKRITARDKTAAAKADASLASASNEAGLLLDPKGFLAS